MRTCGIILITLWCHISVRSQTYNFRPFGNEQGLKETFIYHVSQSGKGYLYLSTGESVTTFDGKIFRTITKGRDAGDFLTTHYVDTNEILWVGHEHNGVTRIKNGQETIITSEALKSVKVTRIIGGTNGLIYVATAGAGLFSVDSALNLKQVALKDQVLLTLCEGRGTSFLAGGPNGLISFTYSKKDELMSREIFLPGSPGVKMIVKGADSLSYWILTQDDDLIGIKELNGGYEHFTSIKDPGKGNPISGMECDESGNLWLGVRGEGLLKIRFHDNAAQSAFTMKMITSSNGLNSKEVYCVMQDREGNMWLGTFGEGLIQKATDQFAFYGTKEKIEKTNINGLLVDTAGLLWLADNDGIAHFNIGTSTYKYYPSSTFFNGEKLNCLTLYNNKLWIGGSHSLFLFDPISGKASNYSKGSGLPDMQFNCLTTKENKIYAGGTDGMVVLDPAEKIHEVLRTDEGLLHNNIVYIFCDSRNRIWICSHGTPPYYIQDGKVTSFKNLAGKSTFRVNSVAEDVDGTIWIATVGDGVFSYDSTGFRVYSTQQGLLSDFCKGIISDKAGNVWVTHKTGLSQRQSNKPEFRAYSENTGLLFSENNLNAFYSTGDGGTWFGTTNGLVHHDLLNLHQIECTPRVFIREVKFDSEPVPLTTELIIKEYGYYSVFISFGAISLSNPEAIEYKYRIAEADTTWKSTIMSHVDLPKLGEGNYTFEVSAYDTKTGLCSYSPAVVRFTIKNPFYKNKWFFLALTVVIISGTYLFIALRTRTLVRSQKLLERKVEEKTFLLQEQKEAVEKIKVQLEKKNKDVTDSINYAKNIQESLLPPHDTINDLFGEDFFVFFKPKDIVSGDFYWVASLNVNNNNKNDLTLAGVIDCTGHGVPGAFLSIMANDFLKQSIINEEVNNTNEILDFLNQGVSTHLNQAGSKKLIKDGMDISLIGISNDRKKLFFSGANNGAYVLRRIGKDIELHTLKPTKQAVGQLSESAMPFDCLEFDLRENDCIYLFSDGYADQFGGPANKKFTYRRFRDLLKAVFHLPMAQQQQKIEQAFENWRNGEEQTDDVCVVGIRV